MAFQLVRGLFSRGSPSRSRIHGPTIENSTVGDQRRDTLYGTRDVEKSAELSNWSELARAPQKEAIGRYSHTTAGRPSGWALPRILVRLQKYSKLTSSSSPAWECMGIAHKDSI